MHDDVYISGHSENNINASCMTISGGRTKQLDIFCRVTGFTSDFLSFIVVELIQFFHGAIQLPGNAMVVLQVNVAPPKTFFTDRLWLPFLSPNQQCQTSKRQVQSFTTHRFHKPMHAFHGMLLTNRKTVQLKLSFWTLENCRPIPLWSLIFEMHTLCGLVTDLYISIYYSVTLDIEWFQWRWHVCPQWFTIHYSSPFFSLSMYSVHCTAFRK